MTLGSLYKMVNGKYQYFPLIGSLISKLLYCLRREECLGRRVYLYLVRPNESEKNTIGLNTYNERVLAALIEDAPNVIDTKEEDEGEYLL